MEGTEPETIIMEDFDRDVACFHALQEGVDSLFVIVGCEGGAEPETVGPAGNLSGLAGKDRVFVEDLFGGWAVDNVPEV